MNFRSSFLENLESQGGFGRADLLAALALYDDDPNRINTILSDLDKVTTADVQQAAKKYLVPANRTIDRSPPGRRWQMTVQITRRAVSLQPIAGPSWLRRLLRGRAVRDGRRRQRAAGGRARAAVPAGAARREDAAERAARHRHAADGDAEGLDHADGAVRATRAIRPISPASRR